jgi:hypothetical protein
MSNTDFDSQQQAPPPQQPYFPQPAPSPLTQVAQQPMGRIASAETPGVNFTGGRLDAAPRDAQTDLPRVPLPPQPPQVPQRYVPASVNTGGRWGEDTSHRQAAETDSSVFETSAMPSMREYPGVIAVAGRQLGQNSAPAVSAPANMASQIATFIGPFLDFYSKNAFSSHYRNQMLGGLAERRQAMLEQRENIEIQRDRMIDSLTQARTNQQVMLKDYDEVRQEMELQKKLHDGQNTPEEIEDANQKIRDLNIKYHHQNLDAYLNKYGIPGVFSYLNWENAKNQDIWNAETAAKADKKKKEDREYDPYLGGGPDAQSGRGGLGEVGGAGEESGVGSAPVTAPETGAAPAAQGQPEADPLQDTSPQSLPDDWDPAKQEAPPGAAQKQSQAAPSRGVQVAGRGDIASDAPEPGIGQVAQAEPQPAARPDDQRSYDYGKSRVLDNASMQYPNLNRKIIDQAALDLIGGIQPKTKSKNALGVIDARSKEIEGNLTDIINRKDLKTADDVIAAVNRVSPTLASHVKGFVDGTMAPPRYANLAKPPWTYLYGLAHKADPQLDMNAFMYRAGTLKDFSSGQDGRNMTSIGTAYGHLYSYIDDLKQLKEFEAKHGKGFMNQLKLYGQERFGGFKFMGAHLGLTPEEQDLFARLDNSMDTAGSEYERALTGGKPTVTGREEQKERMNWKTLDVDRVIGDARDKIDKLKQRMEYQEMRFKAGTGRDPSRPDKPGEGGPLDKMFRAYAAEGRGGGSSDALGATTAANAGTASLVSWMMQHPGQDPPPALYGGRAAPAAPATPSGGKVRKSSDYSPGGGSASGGSTGDGPVNFEEFLR